MQEIFLSIIIPIFNEEKRIMKTVLEIQKYFQDNFKEMSIEIIAVNDGSTDNTQEILENLQKNFSNFYIVNLGRNFGKGYAVKMGMNLAVGKYHLFLDADHSVKINNFKIFFQEINNGYEVVIASIYLKNSKIIFKQKKYKNILGKISRLFIRTFLLKDICDTQRGFKLFTRKASREIFKKQKTEKFIFDVEILLLAKKLDFKIKEISVEWENFGDSKVKLKDYFFALFDLLKIFWNLLLR